MSSKIILFCIIFIKISDAAKILCFFPVPSISHQIVFRPLTQELARRGHELTIITPNPAFPKGKAPANITEIDIQELSYNIWKTALSNKEGPREMDEISQLKMFMEMGYKIFEAQLADEKVKQVIHRKEKYDLVLLEAGARTLLVIPYILKIPVILISSMGSFSFHNTMMGSYMHPLLYPDVNRRRIYNLSILEKIESLYIEYHYSKVFQNIKNQELKMVVKHFGPVVQNIEEVHNIADMLFLNIHPIWEENRAVPPAVKFLGGFHQKAPQRLPEDLQSYLDDSEQGVIYMSFGTNVDPTLLHEDRIRIFTNVFSKLPYNVLWKWNNDNMTGKPDNVRLSKWLPQADLLRHPNVKLFITQAGLQSTDEAITAEVPLIAFPMLGDQWYNAEKYVKHGIGVQLDIQTITEKKLMSAIADLMQNKSYLRNIKRLRTIMYDQSESALDRAVWWTEYVIRHKGARHLRSAAANISWSEFLMLDVVFTLVTSFIICISILWFVAKYLVKSIFIRTRKLKIS